MNKSFLAGVALCALTSAAVAADLPSRKAPVIAPVVAEFDAFASVALGYNWTTAKNTYESKDANGLEVKARGTFYAPILGTGFGFQADGQYERSANNVGEGYGDLVTNTGLFAAHAFARNATGLVGVIAQGNSTSDNFGGDTQNRRYFIGAEGQYFFGAMTFYGQAAYQDFSLVKNDSGEFGGTGLNLAGQVRYFVAPDLMVALKADYEKLNGTGYAKGADLSSWRLGGRAEYRFAATPVSAFGDFSYRSSEVSNYNNAKENETRALVGLKLNFGSKTLFERDRSGASLDPIDAVRVVETSRPR